MMSLVGPKTWVSRLRTDDNDDAVYDYGADDDDGDDDDNDQGPRYDCVAVALFFKRRYVEPNARVRTPGKESQAGC